MPVKGSSEPTHTKSRLVYKSNESSACNGRTATRANLLFWKVDRVLILVRFNIQLVVSNGSDCPEEMSDQRFPLRPLDCVPVGIFSIPERIQGIRGPREQRNIREIVALVKLFRRGTRRLDQCHRLEAGE